MNVELIAYSQRPNKVKNPAGIVEEAACVCYDSKPTNGYKIALACAASGHMSVWEHISFTFRVSGVSRALLAQLTRHRHASFSVRSQRYCKEDGFKYVNPISDGTYREVLIETCMAEMSDFYRELLEMNVPPEDARMVLPNACCTELYLTMNARALIEASHLRLCTRAQKEIREMFMGMRLEVHRVCPEVAGLMRPKCEADPQHPFCTERKSCGRHPLLSEVYKEG